MGLRPHRDENTKLLQGKAKKIQKFEAITEYKVFMYYLNIQVMIFFNVYTLTLTEILDRNINGPRKCV